MYPFGYGLTYSDFDLSDLSVSANKDNSVNVKFYIKNIGDRKASEVVQVYVKDLESNIAQPDLALKGFEKITLNPGEIKEINIIWEEMLSHILMLILIVLKLNQENFKYCQEIPHRTFLSPKP